MSEKLRHEDNETFVTQVQRTLRDLGLYKGAVDGWAGKLTYEAARQLLPKGQDFLSKPTTAEVAPISAKLFAHASKDIGVKEIPGAAVHPRIAEAFKLCPSWLVANDDETAWCGVIMGLWTHELGLSRPGDHYRAASWLNIGKEVDIANARPGDIVVLSRSGGNHVALFKARQGDTLELLGGNQSNAVNVTKYAMSNLRGVRRIG